MESAEDRNDRGAQALKEQPGNETFPCGEPSGIERRAYPRHAVDCAVRVSLLAGAGILSGRLTSLSLGGCLIVAEKRLSINIQVRVELQFQLRGIAFRLVGATVGTRSATCFAIRFLEMPVRRREELLEVLDEVAAENAAKAAAAPLQPDAPEPARVELPAPPPGKLQIPPPAITTLPQVVPAKSEVMPSAPSAATPAPQAKDRRSHGRHAVDTRARLLLVKTGISMPGRILNLSLGGCRIRTEERFNVGIFVRVEAEFYLHGLPFRVGGVSQAIIDKHTIGVRFLDMSERRREQLTELMAEIAEAEAEGAESMPTRNSES